MNLQQFLHSCSIVVQSYFLCLFFFSGPPLFTKTKPKIVSVLLVFVGLCNNVSLMLEVELSHNNTIPSYCSLSNSRKTSPLPFKVSPNGLQQTCLIELTSASSQVIFHFSFAEEFITNTSCKNTYLN